MKAVKKTVDNDSKLTSIWINKYSWERLKKIANNMNTTRNRLLNDIINDYTNTKVVRKD